MISHDPEADEGRKVPVHFRQEAVIAQAGRLLTLTEDVMAAFQRAS
jgi:hypothetical protein